MPKSVAGRVVAVSTPKPGSSTRAWPAPPRSGCRVLPDSCQPVPLAPVTKPKTTPSGHFKPFSVIPSTSASATTSRLESGFAAKSMQPAAPMNAPRSAPATATATASISDVHHPPPRALVPQSSEVIVSSHFGVGGGGGFRPAGSNPPRPSPSPANVVVPAKRSSPKRLAHPTSAAKGADPFITAAGTEGEEDHQRRDRAGAGRPPLRKKARPSEDSGYGTRDSVTSSATLATAIRKGDDLEVGDVEFEIAESDNGDAEGMSLEMAMGTRGATKTTTTTVTRIGQRGEIAGRRDTKMRTPSGAGSAGSEASHHSPSCLSGSLRAGSLTLVCLRTPGLGRSRTRTRRADSPPRRHHPATTPNREDGQRVDRGRSQRGRVAAESVSEQPRRVPLRRVSNPPR